MDYNYIQYKVWDKISHPFPNFNGYTSEVWEWITNFIPRFLLDVITYVTPCHTLLGTWSLIHIGIKVQPCKWKERTWIITLSFPPAWWCAWYMGLLPDMQNCGLRMRWECRERFPRHRCQRKLLVSDPDMHHGTCVTHVPWCMSGSLNRGGGGKRSRHSRRMRNSQFYVSGKRPMAGMRLTRDKWWQATTDLGVSFVADLWLIFKLSYNDIGKGYNN